MKSKYLKIIKIAGIHAGIWLALFFLNYLLISNYPVTFRPAFHAQVWFVYIIVFYLNLFLLLPFFLFKKRFLFYILLSIVLIAGSSYGSAYVRRQHFSRIEIERPRRMERGPRFSEQAPRTERNPGFREDPGRSTSRWWPYFQRRNLSNSMMAILSIFSLSLAYGLFERYRDNEKTRLKTEKEKIQTELNSLKQQVNPHFLFNSLNSIYSLANRKSEKTTEAVLKLSDLLRYMIYDAEKSRVSVNQEFEGLKNYIELQKLKLTDKTRLEVKIRENTEDIMIEPLLLLPVVENAFKYGSDNLHQSTIKVDAVAENGELNFYCSNTIIPGLREQKKKELSGIGLKNVKRRLELIYPGKHELIMEENNGSYKVKMIIKLSSA